MADEKRCTGWNSRLHECPIHGRFGDHEEHAALLAAAKAHVALVEKWGGSQEAQDSIAGLRRAVEECEK